MNPITAKLKDIKVTDADTFRGTVTGMGRFRAFGQNVPFRLTGIDTPESTWRAKCYEEKQLGQEAKEVVQHLIESFTRHEAIILGKDKYGRYLCELFIGGQSVNEYLIDTGLAVPYHGGKKRSWCEVVEE